MRLRNIPGSREVIAENPWCIPETQQTKGKWNSIFGNDHPIHIEIGMGKGQFILTLARQNPHINYVGIEKYSSVLLRGLQKIEEEPLENIRFIRMDAENICEMFDCNEVARGIYQRPPSRRDYESGKYYDGIRAKIFCKGKSHSQIDCIAVNVIVILFL